MFLGTPAVNLNLSTLEWLLTIGVILVTYIGYRVIKKYKEKRLVKQQEEAEDVPLQS